MMIGIDRNKHEILVKRIKRLNELSSQNYKYEFVSYSKALQADLEILSENYRQYNMLMKQLSVVVADYNNLYREVSINAYKILRKVK